MTKIKKWQFIHRHYLKKAPHISANLHQNVKIPCHGSAFSLTGFSACIIGAENVKIRP
jgi:hypothetical protein